MWLYGVARRVLAGHYRGARRSRNLMTRIQTSHAGLPQTAGLLPDSPDERLILALQRLPSAERETIMLVYWEELSYNEAAAVLGCSANAIAIRMHRAKERLRDALASRSSGTAEAIMPLKTYGS